MSARHALALVCLAAMMAGAPALWAQEPTAPPAPPAELGTVSGTVLDKTTGDPLIQASVEVVGQAKRFETDMDGHFTLKLPPGTYELRISAPLYQPVRLQGVKVKANDVSKQSVSLAAATANVEVVEVVAKANKAAEAAQIVERKKSAVVSETVSAEVIKKTPDKDVAAIVKRVPAVTIKDDRFVFIRGLGERYSGALLNESRLPSTDPSRRVVPLDLFPAEFVQSLSILKTYTPDLPGDFSGGLVDIRLMEFPDKPTFSYSQYFGGNTQTTFQKFRTYQGGPLDYLGFGVKFRALPVAVPSTPGLLNSFPTNRADAIGRDFKNIWSEEFVDASPNLGINFAVGDTIGPFGFAFGTNFRTEYLTVPDALVAQFVSGGTNKPLTPTARFNRSNSLFTTRLGSIFTAAYRLNDTNKLFFRSLVDRNTYDNTQFGVGIVSQPYAQRQTILDYTEEQLGFGQLGGEHHWQHVWLDWRTALARSSQHEPDTRYTTYQAGFAPEQPPPSLPLSFLRFAQPYQFTNDSLGGTRIFNGLSEDSTDSAVDFTIPFTTGLPFTDVWSGLPAKFKFGPAYTFRRRMFEQRLFQFNLAPGQPVNVEAPPEVILQPANIVPGVVNLNETTTQGDAYQVSEQIAAGYGLFDLPIVRDRLRFVGGVRLEYSNITLRTTAIGATLPVEVQKNNVDPLPSINLVYSPRYDMNVRGAYSWSVSRPEFRELAPTVFPAPRGLRPFAGNPALIESHIRNYDLRWEWFFSPLELVSLSFFHKSIEEPIEATLLASSGSEYINSFANATSATLTGFEFEVRKNFGFIRPILQNLSLTANVAYINSVVQTPPPSKTGVPLEKKRPLQGQAPYIANAALEYADPQWGTIRLLYQTAGQTLSFAALTKPPVPGIFLQPRNQLDVVGIVPINWFSVPLTLKLGAENLLNDPYVQTQGAFVQTRYQRGIKVGMTLTYAY
jgi:outer membrane receptor protein involved in Fe transport